MLGSRVRAPKGALKMEIRNGLHFFVHIPADLPGQGNGPGKRVMGKPAQRKIPVENRHSRVRTKTFSAHATPEIHHDVRKSGVFTHEKVRPETSHESGRTDESINLICRVSIKR